MLLPTLLFVSVLHAAQTLSSNCKNKSCHLQTSTSTTQSNHSCLEPYCSCINPDILLCNNFSRFLDLNFTHLTAHQHTFKYVELHPKKALDLNEHLQLSGLRLHGTLSLHNLKSLRLDYNPFQSLNYVMFNLAIVDSSFSFNETCLQTHNKRDLIFSKLSLYEFRLVNVTFTQPVCARIFHHSKIERFIILQPSGIFELDRTTAANTSLNTSITEFEFKFRLTGQWLDSYSVLDSEFFKDLRRVSLDSVADLISIEQDTFKRLPNVKDLVVNNVGLKKLLLRSNAWLNSLNYNQPPILWENTYPVDVRSLQKEIFKLIIYFNDEDDWQFTNDSDICLFQSFPHQSLVFPFLVPSAHKFTCTCTIYWLYQNLSKYQLVFNLNEQVMPVHCFSDPNW